MWILVILIVLCFLYISLILMYRRGWLRIPTYSPRHDSQEEYSKVCVVIPARNEEEHIGACLESILQNDYSGEIEIIVVDDFSIDDTAKIAARYPVKIIHLSDHVQTPLNSYKKKAISMAIAETDAEIIICTDADTIVTPYWIQTIVSFFKENNSVFITMPVGYHAGQTALGIFQELDFMTLQGITGAAVFNKMHSMSNGANLAYLKSAFEAVDGFAGIDHLASGDDMLLMEKMAAHFPDRIHYLKSENVIVRTNPMPDVKSFLQQRIRWASKSAFYPDPKIKAVLLMVLLFNLMLLIVPILSLFYNPQFEVGNISFSLFSAWLIILIVKAGIEWFFLHSVARFFGRSHLALSFFLAEPFHILYTVIAGLPRRKIKYEWKGRKVE